MANGLPLLAHSLTELTRLRCWYFESDSHGTHPLTIFDGGDCGGGVSVDKTDFLVGNPREADRGAILEAPKLLRPLTRDELLT